VLRLARLFPCSPDGCRAALEAAQRFRDEHCPEGIDHIARVVVTGPWDEPEDVVAAWRFEGSEAQYIEHYPLE